MRGEELRTRSPPGAVLGALWPRSARRDPWCAAGQRKPWHEGDAGRCGADTCGREVRREVLGEGTCTATLDGAAAAAGGGERRAAATSYALTGTCMQLGGN